MEYVFSFSLQYHQFTLDIIDIFTNIIYLSSFSLGIIYIQNIALSIDFSSFYPTTYNFFHTFSLVVYIYLYSCMHYMQNYGKTRSQRQTFGHAGNHMTECFLYTCIFSLISHPQLLQIHFFHFSQKNIGSLKYAAQTKFSYISIRKNTLSINQLSGKTPVVNLINSTGRAS